MVVVLRLRRLRRAADGEKRHNADLIENLSEGIYRSSIDGRQLSANPALVRLNGYTNEAEQLAGVRDIAKEWYVDPDRRQQFRALLDRDGKVADFVSEIYRHKTRERIWISESARLVHGPKCGRPLYYEGSVREITETVKRLDIEAHFQKLIGRLPVGLFHFVRRADGSFQVLFLAEAALKISGIPVEEQISQPAVFNELVHPEDLDDYLESFAHSAQHLTPWDCSFRITARDGVEKWVRINAQTEAVGGEISWYGYISDISVRKRQEMEIQQLAYFDPLTRLPNRRMFIDRLTETLATCEKSGAFASLLFIDLDNFKALNDSRGHDVGDRLLAEMADRIRDCISALDLAARIGGDEFVIVVSPEGTDAALAGLRAISTANRVLAAMQRGFAFGGPTHLASASIGVVVFDGHRTSANEILKQADIAMYQAKAAGRNGIALYDPAWADRVSRSGDARSDGSFAGSDMQLELPFSTKAGDVADDKLVPPAVETMRRSA